MNGDHVLLITPFNSDYELDVKSLQSHVDFVLSGGVHGVVALGSTGEFFSLKPDERIAAMRAVFEAVRERVPVTVGVGDSGTAVSVELAQRAENFGAAAVMLQAPYYFGHSDTAITAHFLTVAKAVSIPVMIYDGGGGIEVSADTLRMLQEKAPNICYAKLSMPKPSKVAAVIERAPNVKVFCGDDNMLVLALRHGAIGATIGSGNLQPETTAGIYNAFCEGKLNEARLLHSSKIAPAVSICGTSKSEYIRCFKEVLAAKGVIRTATTRLPLVPLDPLRREELFAVMRDLSVL